MVKYLTVEKMKLNIKALKHLPLVAAFLCLPLLESCKDSSDLPDNPQHESGELIEVSLNVNISNSFGVYNGTRADQNSDEYQEGWMSNLYLIAIRDENDKYNTASSFNVFELDTSGYDPQVGTGESKFYVNLYSGTYRFYLIANYDRYLERFTHISGLQSEDEVKDLVLNFTPAMPLLPSHLPMVCEPKGFSGNEFNTGNETPNNDNNKFVLTPPNTLEDDQIEKRSIEINASLEFVCSKVRYTILYDNTPGGISERFGNNSIRFIINQSSDRPKAYNIRKQTRLHTDRWPAIFTGKAEDLFLDGNWILNLNRYVYPENGINYPASSKDVLTPWTDQPNLSAWKASRQRAWQGVVYLPENDKNVENDINQDLTLPDSDKKIANIDKFTILSFPYVLERYKGEDGKYEDAVINDNSDFPEKVFSLFGNPDEVHYGPDYTGKPITDNYSEGLKRGYFYDVVALLKNIEEDRLDMYIQVYVSSQPWIYHESEQVW